MGCLASPAALAAPLEFLGINSEPLEGSISTERPSSSTSPVALPAGHVQIEGGVQLTRGDGGVRDVTLPFLLLRAGLAKNVEVQLGWAGYSITDRGPRTSKGVTDTTLALKVQLSEQNGAMPALGVLGQLSFPSGAQSKTSDSTDPSIGLLWSYDFAPASVFDIGLPGIGLFGTALLTSTTDDDGGRIAQSGIGIGAGVPISERLSAYVEYFGTFTRRQSPQHNANAGLSWLFGRNTAVDAYLGAGLNAAAPNFFIGTGISHRW